VNQNSLVEVEVLGTDVVEEPSVVGPSVVNASAVGPSAEGPSAVEPSAVKPSGEHSNDLIEHIPGGVGQNLACNHFAGSAGFVHFQKLSSYFAEPFLGCHFLLLIQNVKDASYYTCFP
jgi:hypothetical protein